MRKKECVAMLLAGGQGSRLGALTRRNAKPAVAFGGKYRIIDFPLSNVINSGIDTVGVLTQYKPLRLNAYLGNGEAWDLDKAAGGMHVLQPYATENGGRWYNGTADAIYRNMDFIEQFDPEYVLILSADQLYKMDYDKMLEFHKEHDAALTVSCLQVPLEDAKRFGIMTCDDDLRILRFTEKPAHPDSTLASMGIYIFNWPVLRDALIKDHADPESEKDFGKNIIPMLLKDGQRLYSYVFEGYWQDVGTIDSYYNANMDLLKDEPPFDIFEEHWRIFSNSNVSGPQYLGPDACVTDSLICNGCTVQGVIKHSILSNDCHVEAGAVVEESVLLPGAVVEPGARVIRAIVGENAVVKAGAVFCGGTDRDRIAVIGDNAVYETV